ncbi:MAG: hypothetical protein ABSB97_04950 [Thermoplasmata archaeon]
MGIPRNRVGQLFVVLGSGLIVLSFFFVTTSCPSIPPPDNMSGFACQPTYTWTGEALALLGVGLLLVILGGFLPLFRPSPPAMFF